LATWHPILSAVEFVPGQWFMLDGLERPYAIVRLLEVRGELGYRVVTYAPESADRRLIGYYGNLRAATKGANEWFVSNSGSGSKPNPGW
jgi:hypothetical protein